jgi:hypothetical protein
MLVCSTDLIDGMLSFSPVGQEKLPLPAIHMINGDIFALL